MRTREKTKARASMAVCECGVYVFDDYCPDCSTKTAETDERSTYAERHGSRFERQRLRALARDGYRCQSCGVGASDLPNQRGFADSLHVYHKTRTIDGGWARTLESRHALPRLPHGGALTMPDEFGGD